MLPSSSGAMASQIYHLLLIATCVYSYAMPGNDTSSAGPSTVDKPLCPDTCAWHKNTSACYKLYSQGPCGPLQLFYRLSAESPFGECACQSNPDGCNTLVKSNRMVLPAPDNKQCYWAFSQGPCESGQWYILNEARHPECQPNPCQSPDKVEGGNVQILGIGDGQPDDKFTFIRKSTCYRTFTQGFCKDGEYMQFLGTNDPAPKCYKVGRGPPLCLFGIGPIVGMPCASGFKPVGDDCIPADIEFE